MADDGTVATLQCAAPTQATERPASTSSRSQSRLPVLLWALLGLMFAVWLADVGEPWQPGHHQNNAAVWTSASSALRADPIGSRLGGRWEDGDTYTHHPPLIIVETAAAEAVFGVNRVAQRMPAWIGTLVAVLLMDRILRRAGLGATARAVGVVMGFGIPMVFVFGMMLDTPVTSLPFGLACILSWQRARDGDARRWERPVTCCLAVLSGWQAAMLAVSTLVPRRGRTVGAVIGAAAGVALIAGWVMSTGGFGDLFEMMRVRTGAAESAEPMTPGQAVLRQAGFLWDYATPVAGLIGAVGMVSALRSERLRPLAALVAVTTLGYPAITNHAAGHHHYWMFWVSVPIALGAASLTEHGRTPGDIVTAPRLAAAGAVGVLLLSYVLVL